MNAIKRSSLIIAVAAACAVGAAQAKQSTVTGPKGKTSTRMVDRSTPGQVNAVTTGPNGQSVTRNKTYGNGQVNSTTTGPKGQTATRAVTRSNGQANATVTGPNGQTATRTTTY